jgi:TonB family protein
LNWSTRRSAESGGDFYFDLASPRQSTELDWVQQAAAALKKSGLNATVDTTAKVLDDLPSVQGYVNQLATDAPLIKWKPGALAMVLDKDAAKSVASYVQSGVTGFGYYVGDPLSDGYFRPQILFPAYAAGYNLAEAFYASSRYLNGRNVVIGDPLVCPYAVKPRPAVQIALDKETGLPEIFSKRRLDWLIFKYETTREEALLLLNEQSGKAIEPGSRPAASVPAVAQKPVVQTPVEVPPQVKADSVSLDFPSRLISKKPIEYPADAKLARIQGVVVVNLLIDEMGQVMKVDLVSGDKRLAKSVISTVKYWRFEPELENGRPVVSRLSVPVTFRITNKP